MEFLHTLLLLVAVVALGAFSRYKNIFKEKDTYVLSSFVYNFAFPALLVATLSKLKFDNIEIEILIGSLLPIVILLLLIFLLYLIKIITKEQMVIASITLGFGSNAFFGIAYFDSMYGKEGLEFSVITAAVLGIFGVVLSVAMLEYAKNDKINSKLLFSLLLKSPPVIAVILGLALAIFEIDIYFLDKASNLLGKTAGGLAIFSLGMFIYNTFNIEVLKEALPYILLRVLLLPISTYFVLMFMPDLPTDLYSYLFQQSGIPAAISIAIFAQKYDYHQSKLAGIVMLSSFLSFIVLGVLYSISG